MTEQQRIDRANELFASALEMIQQQTGCRIIPAHEIVQFSADQTGAAMSQIIPTWRILPAQNWQPMAQPTPPPASEPETD